MSDHQSSADWYQQLGEGGGDTWRRVIFLGRRHHHRALFLPSRLHICKSSTHKFSSIPWIKSANENNQIGVLTEIVWIFIPKLDLLRSKVYSQPVKHSADEPICIRYISWKWWGAKDAGENLEKASFAFTHGHTCQISARGHFFFGGQYAPFYIYSSHDSSLHSPAWSGSLPKSQWQLFGGIKRDSMSPNILLYNIRVILSEHR